LTAAYDALALFLLRLLAALLLCRGGRPLSGNPVTRVTRGWGVGVGRLVMSGPKGAQHRVTRQARAAHSCDPSAAHKLALPCKPRPHQRQQAWTHKGLCSKSPFSPHGMPGTRLMRIHGYLRAVCPGQGFVKVAGATS